MSVERRTHFFLLVAIFFIKHCGLFCHPSLGFSSLYNIFEFIIPSTLSFALYYVYWNLFVFYSLSNLLLFMKKLVLFSVKNKNISGMVSTRQIWWDQMSNVSSCNNWQNAIYFSRIRLSNSHLACRVFLIALVKTTLLQVIYSICLKKEIAALDRRLLSALIAVRFCSDCFRLVYCFVCGTSFFIISYYVYRYLFILSAAFILFLFFF